MTSMDHAEAHERINDLALERDRFSALVEGHEPSLDGLRAHLSSCPTCRDEVDAWRRTLGLVETALGARGAPDATRPAELAGDPRVTAPPELREAVRAIAAGARKGAPRASGAPVVAAEPEHVTDVPPSPAMTVPPRNVVARRWTRLMPLAAAAAIVVFVAGGLFVADQGRQLQAARDQAQALQAVAVAVDRLLQEPSHWSVALNRPDGTAAGSLAWSTHDLVVVTTALEPPPAGYLYRCWVERNGVRSPIGEMHFAGGTGQWTGYWVGSLDNWATTALAPGSRFGVSLVPLAGGVGGSVVLAADIGS